MLFNTFLAGTYLIYLPNKHPEALFNVQRRVLIFAEHRST